MPVPPVIRPRDRDLGRIPDPRNVQAIQQAALAGGPVIEHIFTSTKEDGDDGLLVQPGDWNDPHKMTLPASTVVGRDATGSGPAQLFIVDSLAPAADGFHIPTSEFIAQAIDNAITAVITGLGIAVTGDISSSVVSTKTGWLLLNGQSIGNTGSGADHSNVDAHDLFILFWGLNNSTWPVLPVRGDSGAQFDWDHNKTIKLPDGRGRVLGMVDGGLNVNTLIASIGAAVGEQNHTLAISEMPSHYHFMPSRLKYGNGIAGGSNNYLDKYFENDTELMASHNEGGGGAHGNVQPTLGVNFFIKL